VGAIRVMHLLRMAEEPNIVTEQKLGHV